MDEFISSNPCNFDHAALFEMLQRLTLDHRLNDSYSCLASIFFGLCNNKCWAPKSDLVKVYSLPLLLVEAVLAYSRSEFGSKRSCIAEGGKNHLLLQLLSFLATPHNTRIPFFFHSVSIPIQSHKHWVAVTLVISNLSLSHQTLASNVKSHCDN